MNHIVKMVVYAKTVNADVVPCSMVTHANTNKLLSDKELIAELKAIIEHKPIQEIKSIVDRLRRKTQRNA